MMNFEMFLLKFFGYFPKVFAAVIGAIFSLVLSGDINTTGHIKITSGVLLKFTFAISISLYGGEAFIEHYNLQDHSVMYHGSIMLMFAVFGMLIIGIVYQSIALLQGKTLREIIEELVESFRAIFRGK